MKTLAITMSSINLDPELLSGFDLDSDEEAASTLSAHISSLGVKNHISKDERRLERFRKQKERKKQRERQKKEEMRAKEATFRCDRDIVTSSVDRSTKQVTKEAIHAKLKDIQEGNRGPRICVDLGLTDLMCDKEVNKLAGQIRRLYGSNRKASDPLHLTLSSLDPGSAFYSTCVEKNDGFANYQIHMTCSSYLEVYDRSDIIYLTPDSEEVLSTLEEDKVYILGGLVDESPQKNHTALIARRENLKTARLPVDEFMTKTERGTFSQILSINQVFDILLTFWETKDWQKALPAGIPKRKGYMLR